jgi:hypothetical protein
MSGFANCCVLLFSADHVAYIITFDHVPAFAFLYCSVMGASLCLLHDLVRLDPPTYKDLVPSFVSILKQITEHRLPR